MGQTLEPLNFNACTKRGIINFTAKVHNGQIVYYEGDNHVAANRVPVKERDFCEAYFKQQYNADLKPVLGEVNRLLFEALDSPVLINPRSAHVEKIKELIIQALQKLPVNNNTEIAKYC